MKRPMPSNGKRRFVSFIGECSAEVATRRIMMPVPMLRQTQVLAPKPKPKLGFSIEELVGDKTEPAAIPPRPVEDSAAPLYPSPECCSAFPGVFEGYPPPALFPGPQHSEGGLGYPGLGRTGCTYVGQPQMRASLPFVVGRDAHLYPWLFSRHARFFPHRIQGLEASTFLFHPYRKPKRIRTAFSPSQLLQLEHAFERNHYVVGSERRQLAQNLNLTETQIKVWFQNRRTKHKRQKQEDDQYCDTKNKESFNPPEQSSSSNEDCHECNSPNEPLWSPVENKTNS